MSSTLIVYELNGQFIRHERADVAPSAGLLFMAGQRYKIEDVWTFLAPGKNVRLLDDAVEAVKRLRNVDSIEVGGLAAQTIGLVPNAINRVVVVLLSACNEGGSKSGCGIGFISGEGSGVSRRLGPGVNLIERRRLEDMLH